MEKRKAFNFFRSYYEVLIMLPDDKSKAQFIEKLCEKQFEGKEPTMSELHDMVKFAYMSQKHSIDASRQGFEDSQKRKNVVVPNEAPTEGGSKGVDEAPTEQEEEEGEVQGEVQDVKDSKNPKGYFDFDIYLKTLNDTFDRQFRVVTPEVKRKMKNALKSYEKINVWNAIRNCKNDNHHKESNYKYCTPEFFARKTTLERHGDKLRKDKPVHKEYQQIDVGNV